jgi:hypothetical protein
LITPTDLLLGKGFQTASSDKDAGAPASVRSMTLETSQVLESGAVWLRYRLHSG